MRAKRITQKEIARTIGLDQRMLSRMVIREGWSDNNKFNPPMRYTVNEDYFKTWTKDSAWVYGWLLTDGSIQENGHISLGLKSEDKEVLEKIKKKMKFSGPIYDKEHSDGRKVSTLRICRKSIAEDLFAIGMARRNKTFNTTFPHMMPSNVYWDFVRGVFEGDGSIQHRTGNTDALNITISGATKQFMIDLQSSLEQRGIFMRLDTRRANSGSGNKAEMYVLMTKSNADALRMCYFMYANTPKDMRLDRKFSVFERYVTTYYDTVRRRSAQCIELIELIRQNIPECREDRHSFLRLVS